jgi:predicted  nucleic acid-binding Zn-ribbon protein
MNTGFQLLQLQQIDTILDKINLRLLEIKSELSQNTGVIKAKEELAKYETKYISEKNLFEQLNDEVQNKKIKKSLSESSLYGGKVTNPKELQDLQQEITSLTSIIARLDDDLLNKLIDLDRREEEMNLTKQNLQQSKTAFETQKSLLVAEESGKKKEIENLKLKKEPLISSIDPSVLAIYTNLRKTKSRTAVVALKDNSCSGCGASLTPNQCQKVRSANELVYCPSCRRIIYGS